MDMYMKGLDAWGNIAEYTNSIALFKEVQSTSLSGEYNGDSYYSLKQRDKHIGKYKSLAFWCIDRKQGNKHNMKTEELYTNLMGAWFETLLVLQKHFIKDNPVSIKVDIS
jgi:hypothetical protein